MTVLFLCRQNAGRSQMAQGFFERLAPGHVALSGGSAPSDRVHPTVVQVEDPSKKAPEEVRRIRDEIRARVEALVSRLRAGQPERAGADRPPRPLRS